MHAGHCRHILCASMLKKAQAVIIESIYMCVSSIALRRAILAMWRCFHETPARVKYNFGVNKSFVSLPAVHCGLWALRYT